MSRKEAWLFLLHVHDHCLRTDGRMIIHKLMVELIEDGWKAEAQMVKIV